MQIFQKHKQNNLKVTKVGSKKSTSDILPLSQIRNSSMENKFFLSLYALDAISVVPSSCDGTLVTTAREKLATHGSKLHWCEGGRMLWCMFGISVPLLFILVQVSQDKITVLFVLSDWDETARI